ncbi:MAG: 2-oxoacid:acceptor oxidoreductase subunit alpha [Candidatus Omnitrophota bacterium]
MTIKISGEAGQGMQAISTALAKVFKKAGLHIFMNQDFMSRIRGGNNFSQLRVSERPVFTLKGKSDITVCLDKGSISIHKPDMAEKGIMITDRQKFGTEETGPGFFDAPFYDMAKKAGGSELFANSAACGVAAGITKISFRLVEEALKEIFADKPADVIKINIAAAKLGYDFSAKYFRSDAFAVKEGAAAGNLLMNGNEAITLGAIRGGCKFYSAYPMSPSTSIMENLSRYAKDFNIIVEQAEDEIAAINMIIGASFAGVRSMCATSGGGFALMVEGLSLAGMLETPIVAVDAQRPAPATGFPTRTEQADLDFLIHAGHGEFARAVFAPGTVEEAFYLTVKAFNLAEKYQIPVLIMTDQHLADSSRDIDPFDMDKAKVERHIISKEDSKKVTGYKRYQLTETGVSPMAVPSWIEDVIYADSDEHTEEGHITEDGKIRMSMVDKRFYKKMALLSREVEEPTAYNLSGADMVLVGFGSTYGVMKEACEATQGKKLGFIHLSQVWPFPSDHIAGLLKRAKKAVTVENNAGAQLAKLIRRSTGIEVDGSILKYDGRPFNADFLKEKASEAVNNGRR